jgi:hypothetical protein
MAASNEHPEVAALQRTAARHISRVAAARRGLGARRSELTKLVAALEEALDQITPPHQRYRIRRWLELTILLMLTIAETVVADTVVQALGLSTISTELVAVVVGGAATGIAWLAGHEWAIAQDPQAVTTGRRSWLGAVLVTATVFLLANLAVRIYYGVLDDQANHLGTGLVAPLLAGSLLTAVTAALMVVAAFVTAHAETAKEAELRRRLHQLRLELGTLDARVAVTEPAIVPAEHLAVIDE